MTPTTYKKGLKAEWLAAWYLRFKGYRILKQRFKTPVGEIDIIASRGSVVVFIEVKHRPDLESALNAVTPQTQQRIRRAASLYLQQYPVKQQNITRFDVIAVVPPFLIRHLDNVDMSGA